MRSGPGPQCGDPSPHVQVSLTGGFVRGGASDTDFKAKMIGFDEDKDIAVLKIDVSDKKVMCDSQNLCERISSLAIPAKLEWHAVKCSRDCLTLVLHTFMLNRGSASCCVCPCRSCTPCTLATHRTCKWASGYTP